MSQTLTSLLVHVVFSTKNRASLITPEIEPDLFAYIGGILKNHESRLIDAGGTENHVHLVISQSENIPLCTILKEIKQGSSYWIKTQDEAYRDFRWQVGYAGFSIGNAELQHLKTYLASQKEHHRKRTFQEELLRFLDDCGLSYDERFLWT